MVSSGNGNLRTLGRWDTNSNQMPSAATNPPNISVSPATVRAAFQLRCRRPCLSLPGLLPRRLWRFGASMLNYHPWFRRREPCLSINYTCKRITNWQNQTISSKSGRETLKRRPRRKKRGAASSSPPIHLRLRWKRSKWAHSSGCKTLYVKP